jgi:hypothetical protein
MKPTSSENANGSEVSEVLSLDKNLTEVSNQTKLSGENIQKPRSSRQSVDKLYLLAGMGVGILILFVYSRRK